ncbi:Cellulose synthase regulatory subunit [Serratia fonticola]|uniref:Cyclic di-GMP-binding protein n=1 Tax=Serratia fonticola TaxID=47917 RepID=A0A4U9VZZ8_SERFO|nr:Cellulose synthase regulatory subunit [Serratia fonticola]
MGAQTGYPALAFSLSDDWSQAKDKDADILLIGTIPPELRDDKKINLLVEATLSWVKMPMRQLPLPSMDVQQDDATPDSKTTISSEGAMAAVVGVQSPFHDQRSIVALLADSPRGYELLNNAQLDSGKRAAMFGSVAVIRESGVDSLRVGDVYYVGHLPWWERIWYALSTHPLLLGAIAALVVVMVALLLRRGLKAFSRRRLSPGRSGLIAMMGICLRRLLPGLMLLCAFNTAATCDWPAWQQYQQFYLSEEGRVIDPSSPEAHHHVRRAELWDVLRAGGQRSACLR